MRLLQLMAGAEEGGAENFFMRLANSLQKTLVDQELLVRPFKKREDFLKESSIKFSTAQFGGVWDFSTRKAVKEVIQKFGPDIVLSWMNRATSFVPVQGRANPFVHIGTPRGYYDPKYYKQCDHLIVTTNDLAKFYFNQGWKNDCVTVLQNFAPDFQTHPISRKKFDTPENVELILALGRFHKNKGFDVLLKSLALLPDCFLWLGGTGIIEQELKRQAHELGVENRVRFLGWLENTAPFFAASDIFVCSSRHEPFGNILIEAWLHKIPLVAAASEGPSQLIEHEKTGLLVPKEDHKAMAKAISRIKNDVALKKSLASAGREKYESKFTEGNVVSQYLDLFKRLVT